VRTFTVAWAIAVAVYAATSLSDWPALQGAAFVAAPTLAAATLFAERRGATHHYALLPLAVLAVSVAVAAYPLAIDLAGSAGPRTVLRTATLWPQLIVLLFGARLLSETATASATRAWRGVGGAPPAGTSLQRRSIWATLLLGLFLTIAFYGIVANVTGGGPLPPVLRAVFGETPINAVIVFVFFVVVAELVELWLGLLRDRALLRGLGRHAGAAELRAHIEALPPEARASPPAHRILARMAEGGTGPASEIAAAEIDDALSRAARRYIRALIVSLPLIGFTGTVIGIMASLEGLPALLESVGAQGGLSAALSGTLGGLATAFQTTLLGLLASLVASLLLAALERAEAATHAACDMLATTSGRAA
jgi:biopolymer transport protein ExbB/TolQ